MANNDMLKYGDGKNTTQRTFNASSSNSGYIKTSPKNKKDTKMQTSYRTENNNVYDIYKEASSGRYYIVDKNGKQSYFSNPNAIAAINKNKPETIWKSGPGGYNYVPPAANFSFTTPATTNNYNNNVGYDYGGGGAGGYGGYGDYGNYGDDLYSRLIQQIEQIQHPKEWTAEELAELFGVSDYYNLDKILSTYNEATDKYYTDAIAEQIKDNDEALRNSSYYANSLLNEYLRSYNNTAPTTIGKGVLAANTIKSMFGADQANEQAASDLNSIVESYREAWKAALEDNKLKAREEYNDLGKYLLQNGLSLNTAQVQNYVKQLQSAATAYTGLRNAQSKMTEANANAYAEALKGALATNQYNAGRASENILRNAYQMQYGNIPGINWQTVYNNANHDANITYSDKSSKD